VAESVLLTNISREESLLKPKPAIPAAPYVKAGFLTFVASRKTWEETLLLQFDVRVELEGDKKTYPTNSTGPYAT